jgi:hypothetical protein
MFYLESSGAERFYSWYYNDCTFEKSPVAQANGKNRYNLWAMIRDRQLSRRHRQPDNYEYFQALRAVMSSQNR